VIVDKARALQQEIQERYEVKAQVEIQIHSADNPHMTREIANYITDQVASQLEVDKIKRYENHKSPSGSTWVMLETTDNIELTAFYSE
jgi:hypothetical protein